MTDSPPPAADALLASGAAVRVLLGTAPPGKAEGLARALVEEGLAACVNVVPGPRSIYRWKGSVWEEPETLLILKTTRQQVAALARRLKELHPYEVPELLSLTPEQGLAAYLGWVQDATAPAGPDGA